MITEGILIPCSFNTNTCKMAKSKLKHAELPLLSESWTNDFNCTIGMDLLRENKENELEINVFVLLII